MADRQMPLTTKRAFKLKSSRCSAAAKTKAYKTAESGGRLGRPMVKFEVSPESLELVATSTFITSSNLKRCSFGLAFFAATSHANS